MIGAVGAGRHGWGIRMQTTFSKRSTTTLPPAAVGQFQTVNTILPKFALASISR